MKNILKKLNKIQIELKAPKGQYNKFGNFNYRSCEDILEALKPLLEKYKVSLIISDTLLDIQDRIYIQATAELICCESEEKIKATALAREPVNKKGMDEAQITGSASSYARKYCLNGLFCIDDTKDADTNEYTTNKSNNNEYITSSQQKLLFAKSKEKELDNESIKKMLKRYGYASSSEIKKEDFNKILEEINQI